MKLKAGVLSNPHIFTSNKTASLPIMSFQIKSSFLAKNHPITNQLTANATES